MTKEINFKRMSASLTSCKRATVLYVYSTVGLGNLLYLDTIPMICTYVCTMALVDVCVCVCVCVWVCVCLCVGMGMCMGGWVNYHLPMPTSTSQFLLYDEVYEFVQRSTLHCTVLKANTYLMMSK
jgi:hypothetical protein